MKPPRDIAHARLYNLPSGPPGAGGVMPLPSGNGRTPARAPGGNPPLGGGGGVTASGNVRTVAIPPYYLEKPPSGIDYYSRETGTLPAVVGAELIVCEVRLPEENKGVNAFLTWFVDAPNLTIDVDWSLLVNGSPQSGWTGLGTFPRVALNLSSTIPGTVFLPKGARVQVRIRNNAATGPWLVGAEIGGWSWPAVAELDAFGARPL